jgi:hypothetical protein
MATPVAHPGVIVGAKMQAMTILDILSWGVSIPRSVVDVGSSSAATNKG